MDFYSVVSTVLLTFPSTDVTAVSEMMTIGAAINSVGIIVDSSLIYLFFDLSNFTKSYNFETNYNNSISKVRCIKTL